MTIVDELHTEMKYLLQTIFSVEQKDAPRSEDHIAKSVSFQAYSAEVESECNPSDLLVRCAALCSIFREDTDRIVIQILCWLPTLLLQ